MKKHTLTLKLFFIFLLALFTTINGQVGVNTINPQTTLDVVGKASVASSLDGIIAPRLTGDELFAKTYTTTQQGAIVYVTSAASVANQTGQTTNVKSSGYYYFDGTIWIRVVTANNSWLTTGNSGTTAGTNFLGTTDDVDLIFKRSGVYSGWISGNGVSPSYNTSFGYASLNIGTAITGASFNSAFGNGAMAVNTSGSRNTAVGNNALASNTTGVRNTAIGNGAGVFLTTGNDNVAVGHQALVSSAGSAAIQNVAIGNDALRRITTGSSNVGIGHFALNSNTTGTNNVAIGATAGTSQTSGDRNIIIGATQNSANATGSNQLNIGGVIFGTGLTGSAITPAGSVGIGTPTPTQTLDVNGNTFMRKAVYHNFSSTSAIGSSEYTVLLNGNITLPPASTNKNRVLVLCTDGSNSSINILPSATTELQDGTSPTEYDAGYPLGITSTKCITVQSTGGTWWVIATSK